jgi:hypothetical protein
VVNRIADYLTIYVTGQKVLDGLWGCDLKKFEPHQLVDALYVLELGGPFDLPAWPLNAYQKDILRFIIKSLGRPVLRVI